MKNYHQRRLSILICIRTIRRASMMLIRLKLSTMAIHQLALLLSLLLPPNLSFVQLASQQSCRNYYLPSRQSFCNNMLTKNTEECFEGEKILLTGASGGLGRALAENLSSCGVDTLILSGRNKDSLTSVSEKCKKLSPKTNIEIVTCDLEDRDSVKQLGEKAIEICGTVDVLINNGGVSSRSNFLDTELEIDERVMQINFFSGAALSKILVPNMITNNESGKIIWISSVQGLLGIPSRTSYAASKFAVQGYCEGLRAELAGNNIQISVASPGYIRTGLSEAALTGDGTNYGQMDETTAKGADPDDVAKSILNSVANGATDFVVAANASAKLAIWMRLLCPSILQKLLVKRFKKSNPQKEKVE